MLRLLRNILAELRLITNELQLLRAQLVQQHETIQKVEARHGVVG